MPVILSTTTIKASAIKGAFKSSCVREFLYKSARQRRVNFYVQHYFEIKFHRNSSCRSVKLVVALADRWTLAAYECVR